MRHALTLLAALIAAPAAADVERAVTTRILPGAAAFFAAADALRDAAAADCAPAPLIAPWNAAFDAWMGISHLRLGPLEEDGRAVAIAFWPDDKGMTPKSLGALVRAGDPIIETPEGVAQVSVAARGLFGISQVLRSPELSSGPYGCALTRALTADLAAMAAAIDAEWRGGFGQALIDADGGPFRTAREARQALFTVLIGGIEVTAEQRLARPMGTFERPRPKRAEAWREGRSLRNVQLSLAALHGLAGALADAPIPATDAAFAHARALADALDDPALAGVAEPSGRFKVEALYQAVEAARDAATEELGAALGVKPGFNAGDGD